MFYLQINIFTLKYLCAIDVFETGQDWKIAALRTSIYVHFLFEVHMNVKYLNLALENAKTAFDMGEVPVGAVIVRNNTIISSAYNLKENRNCSIFHAEILAIIEASKKLGNWRLSDCDMYVSLDPCPMCASAIKQSRISNVYSAYSHSLNNSNIIKSIFSDIDNNSIVNFETNLSPIYSKFLLDNFFSNKR